MVAPGASEPSAVRSLNVKAEQAAQNGGSAWRVKSSRARTRVTVLTAAAAEDCSIAFPRRSRSDAE